MQTFPTFTLASTNIPSNHDRRIATYPTATVVRLLAVAIFSLPGFATVVVVVVVNRIHGLQQAALRQRTGQNALKLGPVGTGADVGKYVIKRRADATATVRHPNPVAWNVDNRDERGRSYVQFVASAKR